MNQKAHSSFYQPHTFILSKKLTADSMMIYSVDGKNIFKKVSHVIQHDPLYVWNKLYGVGNKLSLAKCAYNKLAQIIQNKHPELYETKEKKKLLYKNHTIPPKES
jgi:hypothetical protein